MHFPQTFEQKEIHTIAKNLEYTLQLHQARHILLVSDLPGEGKSMVMRQILPLMTKIYQRKVLLLDMAGTDSPNKNFFMNKNSSIEYIGREDLDLIDVNQDDVHPINVYLDEIGRAFDFVFVDIATPRNFEGIKIPPVKLDGAILIKTKKSLNSKRHAFTDEVLDRNIPILGIIYNEGVK